MPLARQTCAALNAVGRAMYCVILIRYRKMPHQVLDGIIAHPQLHYRQAATLTLGANHGNTEMRDEEGNRNAGECALFNWSRGSPGDTAVGRSRTGSGGSPSSR